MKYERAIVIAETWRRKLEPFCDRIEIAGSLRRRESYVGDIELLCIPKVGGGEDLFGTTNHGRHPGFAEVLKDEMEAIILSGKPSIGKYIKLQLVNEPIKIDVFTAATDNWGHLLAIRTGPADYSHRVLGFAWVKAGYHSADGKLMHENRVIPVKEEQDLFNLIGIPYTKPEDRKW